MPFPVRRRDDGQKGFFRDEEVKRKRRELRAENGYVSKAHQEEDAVRKRRDHSDEMRKQQEYVTHYLEWVVIQIILLLGLLTSMRQINLTIN